MSTNSNVLKDCTFAFLVGGAICTFGQLITNLLKDYNLSKDDVAAYTNIILILLAVIFTGLGIYSKLGEFSGAGSLVPITGFANSVAASPAFRASVMIRRVSLGTTSYSALMTDFYATSTGLDITTVFSRSVPVKRL